MDLILAIESSCDETSLAILDVSKVGEADELKALNQIQVLDTIVSSQIEIHKEYGGVIPEIGARQHAGQIHLIYNEILENCRLKHNLSTEDVESAIKTIKVTTSPGLASALRVGLEFGKSLKFFLDQKYGLDINIQEINHLKGHFTSCFYQQDQAINLDSDSVFPHLHLLVSGGNTQLILAKSLSDAEIVGATTDDAAGECMDKIGRMVGLPYPGGLWMSKIIGLNKGNPCNLTVPLTGKPSLQFSYSGLKTAARYYLQAQKFDNWSFEQKLSETEISELMAFNQGQVSDLPPYLNTLYQLLLSSHTVAIQHLVDRLKIGINKYNPKTLGLSGGVSASPSLREQIQNLKLPALLVPKALTGDNAVMIGLVK